MIKTDICACHNTTTFLRSLYFQLTLAGNPPQVAADLVPKIVDALKVIDRGFYKLP